MDFYYFWKVGAKKSLLRLYHISMCNNFSSFWVSFTTSRAYAYISVLFEVSRDEMLNARNDETCCRKWRDLPIPFRIWQVFVQNIEKVKFP